MIGVMQKNQLREAVEYRRTQLISQLISIGTFEDLNGRQLYELTLTELEEEMRWINMQREGDMIY
ncbi:Fur-regulated basic protein FbpA [Fictibacillus sp. 7GRE50]|uniref:Fur-regulated basic protein FbpA n=1 Tax=Fictibacillus sp. 7GRE50 TaxID=2745878 RepID=UPI001E61C39F|nr:Fur-regulated basic protein FbpA [Fictibacillus sp. 7GRE50]